MAVGWELSTLGRQVARKFLPDELADEPQALSGCKRRGRSGLRLAKVLRGVNLSRGELANFEKKY